MTRSSFLAALIVACIGTSSAWAQKIYWVSNEVRHTGVDARIQRANLDGSGAEVLFTMHSSSLVFRDIALDQENEKMYWIAGSQIWRANLDGSRVEPVLDSIRGARLALDPGRGHIYWTQPGGLLLGTDQSKPMARPEGINRANLDGSDIVNLVSSDPCGSPLFPPCVLRGMALDPDAGRMYWAHSPTPCPPIPGFPCPTDGEIRVAELDGSDIRTVVDGLANPARIALDPQAGTMYWSAINAIQKAYLDGSRVEDVVTGIFPSAPIAVDAQASKIYYFLQLGTPCISAPGYPCPDPVSFEVRRADLNGANQETVFAGHTGGIALDLPDDGCDTLIECDDLTCLTSCCPFESAAQGSRERRKNLRLLRHLRDDTLAKTATGRRYIDLYYEHAQELSRLMLAHPALRSAASETMAHFMPKLESFLAGEQIALTPAERIDLLEFLESVAAVASPELRENLIRTVKTELLRGDSLRRLNVGRRGHSTTRGQ